MSKSYVTADRLLAISADLTQRDRELLSFVSDVRLASGYQLIRHFWHTADGRTAAARAGRRTLKRLVDWRVLDVLPRRVGGIRAGSDGLVYSVGVAGTKVLASTGATRARLATPGALYVAHTLAISETLVALGEAHRWSELELIRADTEPACWRSFLGPVMARDTLKPDLFVRVGAGALEDRWFVEIDLGTEASGTIRRKGERYLSYYRAGDEQRQHGVFPRVVWAAPDDHRAEQITEALPKAGARLFAVCRRADLIAFLASEARS